MSNRKGISDEFDRLRIKWKSLLNGGMAFSLSNVDIFARIAAIYLEAKLLWNSIETAITGEIISKSSFFTFCHLFFT